MEKTVNPKKIKWVYSTGDEFNIITRTLSLKYSNGTVAKRRTPEFTSPGRWERLWLGFYIAVAQSSKFWPQNNKIKSTWSCHWWKKITTKLNVCHGSGSIINALESSQENIEFWLQSRDSVIDNLDSGYRLLGCCAPIPGGFSSLRD
jgi:hypothetical protein